MSQKEANQTSFDLMDAKDLQAFRSSCTSPSTKARTKGLVLPLFARCPFSVLLVQQTC
jgi:hypothetical protein